VTADDEADALWLLDYGIAKLPKNVRDSNDVIQTSATDGIAEARSA